MYAAKLELFPGRKCTILRLSHYFMAHIVAFMCDRFSAMGYVLSEAILEAGKGLQLFWKAGVHIACMGAVVACRTYSAVCKLKTCCRWATFIGMAILMASTPASAIFVKKIIMFRRKMLKETDSRVKLTNQLLSGIRVLKIYAWEAAQEAQIQEARDRELRRLKQAIPCRVGMQTLLFAAPVLAAVASFAVYGSVDPDGFTAPRIFASIALFAIMRFPLIFLPFALVEVSCNSMLCLCLFDISADMCILHAPMVFFRVECYFEMYALQSMQCARCMVTW